MQEITEIPDDYLNQSHVLKHLAKEIKIPINRRSNTRDSGVSENTDTIKDPPKYGQWIIEEQNEQNNNKIKSKSQPDLTKYAIHNLSLFSSFILSIWVVRPLVCCFRLAENDVIDMEAMEKENLLLKQQLHTCYMKVSKTQKVSERSSH